MFCHVALLVEAGGALSGSAAGLITDMIYVQVHPVSTTADTCKQWHLSVQGFQPMHARLQVERAFADGGAPDGNERTSAAKLSAASAKPSAKDGSGAPARAASGILAKREA